MPILIDLSETLTRYEAYQELRELWQNGIVAIERIQPQYVSKADSITLRSLVAAVELIDKRLLELSGFDMKKFDLRRTIDGIQTAETIQLTEREELARKERENKRTSLPDRTKDIGQSGRDLFS